MTAWAVDAEILGIRQKSVYIGSAAGVVCFIDELWRLGFQIRDFRPVPTPGTSAGPQLVAGEKSPRGARPPTPMVVSASPNPLQAPTRRRGETRPN